METPEQLQRLVAPIALYPDSLVASLLAASSYPAQITEANNWLAPRRNFSPQELANEAHKESGDSSVKELPPFSSGVAEFGFQSFLDLGTRRRLLQSAA